MHPHQTANDRFKSGFGSAFWLALIAATALHAAILLGSPTFVIAMDGAVTGPPITVMPPEPPLPDAPDAIVRPAEPIISNVAPPDVTMAPTVPDAGNWAAVDPPRPEAGDEASRGRIFTIYEVAPVLRNADAVQSALRRVYPPALRDAGIGGVVRVWFHIDEAGRVVAAELHGSSGYEAFDRAALEVAEVMTFRPAQNRDRAVPVWVSLEIRFEAP